MEIAAITRFKHGKLLRALRKLGWSQSKLAEEAGLSPSQVGEAINLRKRPSVLIAERIELCLQGQGIDVDANEWWPESFRGTGRSLVVEQFGEVAPERIAQVVDPCPRIESHHDYGEVLETLLRELSEREQYVIRERLKGVTLKEIAKKVGVSQGRMGQIEEQAILKMRSPRGRHLLDEAMGNTRFCPKCGKDEERHEVAMSEEGILTKVCPPEDIWEIREKEQTEEMESNEQDT